MPLAKTIYQYRSCSEAFFKVVAPTRFTLLHKAANTFLAVHHGQIFHHDLFSHSAKGKIELIYLWYNCVCWTRKLNFRYVIYRVLDCCILKEKETVAGVTKSHKWNWCRRNETCCKYIPICKRGCDVAKIWTPKFYINFKYLAKVNVLANFLLRLLGGARKLDQGRQGAVDWHELLWAIVDSVEVYQGTQLQRRIFWADFGAAVVAKCPLWMGEI